MWGLLRHCMGRLINTRSAGRKKTRKSETEALKIKEGQCAFEHWGHPANKYNYFGRAVEAIENRWTGAWPEYMYQLHRLRAKNNKETLQGITQESIGEEILEMLWETLRGGTKWQK